jgi:hypothetical protein
MGSECGKGDGSGSRRPIREIAGIAGVLAIGYQSCMPRLLKVALIVMLVVAGLSVWFVSAQQRHVKECAARSLRLSGSAIEEAGAVARLLRDAWWNLGGLEGYATIRERLEQNESTEWGTTSFARVRSSRGSARAAHDRLVEVTGRAVYLTDSAREAQQLASRVFAIAETLADEVASPSGSFADFERRTSRLVEEGTMLGKEAALLRSRF